MKVALTAGAGARRRVVASTGPPIQLLAHSGCGHDLSVAVSLVNLANQANKLCPALFFDNLAHGLWVAVPEPSPHTFVVTEFKAFGEFIGFSSDTAKQAPEIGVPVGTTLSRHRSCPGPAGAVNARDRADTTARCRTSTKALATLAIRQRSSRAMLRRYQACIQRRNVRHLTADRVHHRDPAGIDDLHFRLAGEESCDAKVAERAREHEVVGTELPLSDLRSRE